MLQRVLLLRQIASHPCHRLVDVALTQTWCSCSSAHQEFDVN